MRSFTKGAAASTYVRADFISRQPAFDIRLFTSQPLVAAQFAKPGETNDHCRGPLKLGRRREESCAAKGNAIDVQFALTDVSAAIDPTIDWTFGQVCGGCAV